MSTTKQIRVTYDYQIFSRQRFGGISRYFCELAKVIEGNQNFKIRILAGAYINEYLRTVSPAIVLGLKIPKIPKAGNVVEQANISLSKLWLQKYPVEIVHETFYSCRDITPSSVRKVLTVYDMIDEKFYPNSDVIQRKKSAIRRADHIICISHSVKNDLLNFISIDPSKVSVIYLGYSSNHNLQDEQFCRKPIDSPYILYVGHRYGYKNFEKLLQAYANSERLKKNFKLVCFGGPPFSSDELSRFSQLGIAESSVLHFWGSDTLLNSFYQGASAFVYPSMYEGFGIPPLEAMSFNCPVVCSNTSSIPEVVGDAAEFFDPYDLDSIVSALEKVLFSSEDADSLVQLGLKRIQNFSWQTCADKTSLVYSSLV